LFVPSLILIALVFDGLAVVVQSVARVRMFLFKRLAVLFIFCEPVLEVDHLLFSGVP
jgi:hypothetical protein